MNHYSSEKVEYLKTITKFVRQGLAPSFHNFAREMDEEERKRKRGILYFTKMRKMREEKRGCTLNKNHTILLNHEILHLKRLSA